MTMPQVDMDAVRMLIEDAARLTIMPRFRQLSTSEVDQKAGPHDVVTIADKESEAYLEPRLRALLPGSTVVGEEAVSGDEGIMEALRRPGRRLADRSGRRHRQLCGGQCAVRRDGSAGA